MDQAIMERILAIVREAGAMVRAAHTEQSEITEKAGSANFVTVHDVRTQQFLIGELSALLPHAAFIAEEKENDSEVLRADACFVIDPIDGTTNFIHNTRHSAISVALLEHGVTCLGAILDPYQDELFYAVRGKGAFLDGAPIHVSDTVFSDGLVGFGTSPYCKDTLTEATFALCRDLYLSCSDVRRMGSAALDLAYLAAGRFDMFFEMILSPWDIAAGALLITEAGGRISDMHGNPLSLAAPTSVIAASPTCYDELLAHARRYAHF